MEKRPTIFSEPIGIIGTGVAGLINAHVLSQDGFTNIRLVTRDKSVGGIWARERVYPGLYINNVHGEYRFSSLEMPLPTDSETTGGRLSGLDMCNYMETFYDTFLKNKVKVSFHTEVSDISRDEKGIWLVRAQDLSTGSSLTLQFSRIVLATGGCSEPEIPDSISPTAAEKAHFRGLVMHSSQFGPRFDDVLKALKLDSGSDGGSVLVIGGGKSAHDICAKLYEEGCNQIVSVFEKNDVFLAGKKPLPDVIRKSRLLPLLSPHIHLRTRLERFLHGTTLGGKITRFLWDKIEESSFAAFDIPHDSPLRNAYPLYWSVRTSDEGAVRPTHYYSLVTRGKIEVIAPARVIGFAADSRSVMLDNGRTVTANVIILATGYTSSWSKIFSEATAEEIGINRHAPTTQITDTWDYPSLVDPPPIHPDAERWITSIYRGLVPAKNILRRDFAIAGALFTANVGYTTEVAAHWTSSYFQSDPMRLPATPEEAIAAAEREGAWKKRRYPSMLSWANESYSGTLDFWSWPQAADDMLEDMYLPCLRSGGNWITWPFKIIDLKEIATLGDERRARRLAATAP